MSRGLTPEREGYRSIGAHAFALKLFALIAGCVALTATLAWLVGDKVSTSILWPLIAIIWIVRSMRSILNPAREQNAETGEPSIRSIRAWNIAMLIVWTALGIGFAMLSWGPKP